MVVDKYDYASYYQPASVQCLGVLDSNFKIGKWNNQNPVNCELSYACVRGDYFLKNLIIQSPQVPVNV